jgi:negative regulator of sigma E activity
MYESAQMLTKLTITATVTATVHFIVVIISAGNVNGNW